MFQSRLDETTNGFENRERLLAVRRALLSGNKEQVNELWKQVGAESGVEAQTALLAVDHGVYAAAWVALCALGDGCERQGDPGAAVLSTGLHDQRDEYPACVCEGVWGV